MIVTVVPSFPHYTWLEPNSLSLLGVKGVKMAICWFSSALYSPKAKKLVYISWFFCFLSLSLSFSPQVPSSMSLTHLLKCCFDEVAYFGKCLRGAAVRFNSLSFL